MRVSFFVRSIVGLIAILGVGGSAAVLAQQPAPEQGRGAGQGRGGRPAPPPAALVMSVQWQLVPGVTGSRPNAPTQVPIAQGNIVDPNVELKQYGAGKVLTSNRDSSTVWTGEAEAPFAVTFRHKNHALDLTGAAKIRWTIKTSGFHVVRPVLKLADGTLMVGDFTSASVPIFATTEFPLATIRWVRLDPERAVTVNSRGNSNEEIWVQNPDLSKVEEVGFADLMPGSGHGPGGFIHVGTIEVFGRTSPRAATTSTSR